LKLPENHPKRGVTVREFLALHSLSVAFRDFYLIPMTAAIWSATADDMLNFPALTLFTFLHNHLLLQVSEHINWQTPSQRSQQYVQLVAKELGDRVRLNTHITSIKRLQVDNGYNILVTTSDDKEWCFDELIFACHPDQSLTLLGDIASEEEKKYLGAFHYAENDTYVHCDEHLMPKSKSAWTSWNYLGTTAHNNNNQEANKSLQKPVFVTYWLNKLQSLEYDRPIFVSLNPSPLPAADKIFARIAYAHPQYSLDSIAAQRALASIQGHLGTYYCGAYMGYGFHEDGFRSGIEVAMAVSGVPVPWLQKHSNAHKRQAIIPKKSSIIQSLFMPARVLMENLCQQQVLKFLQTGLVKGAITFILPDGRQVSLQGEHKGDNAVIKVKSNWFFVRIALEADIGMARSYIADEWEVMEPVGSSSAHYHPYDNLTTLLTLLIDNMPNGNSTELKGGWDAKKLFSAYLGSTFNQLYYTFMMDNSIANSQSNIHAHYDLSNALFESFLDQQHMMYSSALFRTLATTGDDSVGMSTNENIPVALLKCDPLDRLEDAQTRKIDMLLSHLEPMTCHDTLLDIGFGWGGICIRAAQRYQCKVKGITLSVEQLKYAREKVLALGLDHLITFELIDYRQYAVYCKQHHITYDRIVSCEMIEAVGHIYLSNYFASVESLLTHTGIFCMQAITMPDSRYENYLHSTDFINTIIFPGGCCPSLSALLHAMSTHSSLYLDNCHNLNIHYAETLRRWRYAFNRQHDHVIGALGFDEHFMKLWNLYLCYCEAGFDKQVLNLQILTFSRPGNPNMLAARAWSKDK
jgi:cyclopropane-fatty-acyl-phospholipid synthase